MAVRPSACLPACPSLRPSVRRYSCIKVKILALAISFEPRRGVAWPSNNDSFHSPNRSGIFHPEFIVTLDAFFDARLAHRYLILKGTTRKYRIPQLLLIHRTIYQKGTTANASLIWTVYSEVE